MEENNLSWRARLAKSNINILDIHDDTVFLEFTYHPRPGTFKWCKTAFMYRPGADMGSVAQTITKEVLSLRRELEND